MFISNDEYKRIYLCVAIIFLLLGSSGCRRDPAEPTKLYDAEIKAMEQARVKKVSIDDIKVKDHYPWQKERPSIDTLPPRVKVMERTMQYEIDYLHEFIRGKKKTKLQLRD